MERKPERRAHLRFSVKEAAVEFESEKGKGSGPVSNMSIGGVCFCSDMLLEVDEVVKLVLKVPGEDPLPLLGRIRWRGVREREEGWVYGIEFSRFGDLPDENDPAVLLRLIALEAKCLGSGLAQ